MRILWERGKGESGGIGWRGFVKGHGGMGKRSGEKLSAGGGQ